MSTIESAPQASPSKEEAKKTLQATRHSRMASLTDGESAVLHALLIDPPRKISAKNESEQSKRLNNASKVLDDDMLFSIPFEYDEKDEHHRVPPKPRRRLSNWIGLWKAFEEGIRPRTLLKHAPPKRKDSLPREIIQETVEEDASVDQDDDRRSLCSDRTQPGERTLDSKDDASSASSWDEEEGGYEHYDAWAVLKDEYAGDFGFDYSLRSTPELDLDEEGNKFVILGTSADDKTSQPHVLSPPLMDSLMNFLPESLSKENWWLKYSLVRDGASLETFRRYVRGAQYILLAIETTKGDVFGAFTGSYWRTQYGFYGSGEAFVWKMRHNRMSPCNSLFEQAQLETEIDVFFYAHLNRFVQLLTHDKLAIGGGELPEDDSVKAAFEIDDSSTVMTPTNMPPELDEDYGFGIALTDDLLRGSSSPCATFRSPCLVHRSSRGETFDVVNLEAWSFTPCFDVNSAEKLEMTKFFIHESTRTLSSTEHSAVMEELVDSGCGSPRSLSSSSQFNAKDLIQKKFYRRVGENDRSQEQRDRWQYMNMMG